LTLAAQDQAEALATELTCQQNQYKELIVRFRALKKTGLDERTSVKLRILSYLYGRVVNFQAHCDDDKKEIEKLLSEVQPALKTGIEDATKPI